MLKHVYLIFIATFIFGFVTGFILWLFNNTGDEADQTQTVSKGLSITAHEYGACASSGCASYRITEKGDYTYIVRFRNAPEIRDDGELSSTEFRQIQSVVKQTDLNSITETKFNGACPTTYNGLGYRYTVQSKGKFYSFDSCKEDLDGEKLFENLKNLFKIFKDSDRET